MGNTVIRVGSDFEKLVESTRMALERQLNRSVSTAEATDFISRQHSAAAMNIKIDIVPSRTKRRANLFDL